MHSHPRPALHLLQGEDILLHPRRQPRKDQWKRQRNAGPQVRSGPFEHRTLARPRQHQRHEQPEGDSGNRQQRQCAEARGEEERRRYHGDCNSGCQSGGCGESSNRRVPPRGEVVIDEIEYLYIIEHTYIHNTYGVAQDISYSLHTFSMICVHSSVPVFVTRYEHSLVLEYPYGIEPLSQAMTLSLASGCPTLVSYPSLFQDIQPRLARGRVTSLSRVFLSALVARYGQRSWVLSRARAPHF